MSLDRLSKMMSRRKHVYAIKGNYLGLQVKVDLRKFQDQFYENKISVQKEISSSKNWRVIYNYV